MLEIKNVTKIFNRGTANEKVALHNVSLTVNDGDFITVIGGNGAGKSTMLNTICGVFPIDEGKVILNGNDITKLPTFRRAKYLGRVFQDPIQGTAPNMEIQENLAIAYRRTREKYIPKHPTAKQFFEGVWAFIKSKVTLGIPKKEKELYKTLLKRLDLGLENRMKAKVGLLSGGQRQSITLLMATLKKPDLLLLDEHTAALDPKTAAKVMQLTEEITSESNITTIMITHNMKDAIRYGNRLIMMHEGTIIYDVAGEDKQNLKVEDLLKKFEENNGELSDRMMLI